MKLVAVAAIISRLFQFVCKLFTKFEIECHERFVDKRIKYSNLSNAHVVHARTAVKCTKIVKKKSNVQSVEKYCYCKMLRERAYVPKTLKVKPLSSHEITKAVPYF